MPSDTINVRREDIERWATIEQDVHRILKALEGNGKPGLIEKVSGLERKTTDIQEKLECHLDEEKEKNQNQAQQKKTTRARLADFWEKAGLEIVKMIVSIILAWLLITFGLK